LSVNWDKGHHDGKDGKDEDGGKGRTVEAEGARCAAAWRGKGER